jgi:hypothetical protein
MASDSSPPKEPDPAIIAQYQAGVRRVNRAMFCWIAAILLGTLTDFAIGNIDFPLEKPLPICAFIALFFGLLVVGGVAWASAYCPSCGAFIKANANLQFCPKCGVRLANSESQPRNRTANLLATIGLVVVLVPLLVLVLSMKAEQQRQKLPPAPANPVVSPTINEPNVVDRGDARWFPDGFSQAIKDGKSNSKSDGARASHPFIPRPSVLPAAEPKGPTLPGPDGTPKKVPMNDSSIRLELVGRITAKKHVGRANLAVQGKYAYLARDDGVRVVDLSNPKEPRVIATPKIPGGALASTGRFLYVLADNKLHVVDIDKPAAPNVVAAHDLQEAFEDLVVGGTHAYLVHPKGLQIFDVSDPAKPREGGSCALEGRVQSIAAAGKYAYVGTEYHGLRIVDISNSAKPEEVGRFKSSGDFMAVAVAGDFAYVADFDAAKAALWIIDVSDRKKPKEAARYDAGIASGVAISGKRVFLAAGGLHVLDVTDPTKPKKLATYGAGTDVAGHVAVAGGYVYLTGEGPHDFTILRVVADKRQK